MARLVNLANFQQFASINLTADPGYDPGHRTIPFCAEIRLIWNLEDGKAAYNVLHASYTGPFQGSQTQASNILAGLTGSGTWTALAAFLAPTTNLPNVDIRDLNVVDTARIPGIAVSHPGTSAGTSLPNEVAAVITLRTANVGPANRGRIFIPGWATTALGSGNVIAAAAVTALGNWGSIIAGVLSTSGYTLGVGHFSRLAYVGSSGTPHPARAAGVVPVLTASVRDNHWDSQRRRGLR
jgi:hypothetical protein